MLSLKSPKELLSLAAEEYINGGPSTTRIIELQEAYISVRKSSALNKMMIGILLALFGIGLTITSIATQMMNHDIFPELFYLGVAIALTGIIMMFMNIFTMSNTHRLVSDFNKRMIRSLTSRS